MELAWDNSHLTHFNRFAAWCRSLVEMSRKGKSALDIRKSTEGVTLFTISQATAATFDDLYIGQTFLCFIRSGTKKVLCPVNGELLAKEGDLILFPPESFVSLENRPLRNAAYRADGVYFADELVAEVFPEPARSARPTGIHILSAEQQDSRQILAQIRETVLCEDLPAPIRHHRLLEPLIWLRHHGMTLALPQDSLPVSQVRRLLETDLSRSWRISEVARHFAMSEATLRRWLAGSGHGFAKILHNARLERGLGLLQTTDLSISRIALECGFGTPSHFSASFRKRFGVAPKYIRSAEE